MPTHTDLGATNVHSKQQLIQAARQHKHVMENSKHAGHPQQ